ncbi:hypothetical protein QN277_002394 [Acacia crassicarpa]|uniref:Uncharacterized protein n=1 Tax=Acacia crassicarpa TaxID=499986 RepID=A0AAE1TJI1_9FABA|nr:hypothetical protein QN277_002394 [Acacia crassicarpa]
MAKSKDDIKPATSQARHSEDEPVRVAYRHGTPPEAGKIADSDIIEVFSSARNVSKAQGGSDHNSSQLQQRKDHSDDDDDTNKEAGRDFSTGPPRLPKMGASSAGYKY